MIKELVKEYSKQQKTIIENSQSVYKELIDLKNPTQEVFICFYLRKDNSLITRNIINIGSSSMSIVDVKELVRQGILLNASGVIIAHNHPSGNIKPSPEDIKVSEKLKIALNYFEIKLLDSIIFSEYDYETY